MTKRRADTDLEPEQEGHKKLTTSTKELAHDLVVDLECFSHRPKFELLIPNTKAIGAGFTSSVYEACPVSHDQVDKTRCMGNYIVKILRPRWDAKDQDREVNAMMIAHDVGLSPALLDSWTCKTTRNKPDVKDPKTIVGFLVMQRIQDRVPSSVWLEDADRIVRCGNFLRALVQFHQRGWTHNDIHQDNILLERGKSNVWLIDYGSATKIDKNAKTRTMRELAEASPHDPRTAMWKWILEQKDWISSSHAMTDNEQEDIFNAVVSIGWGSLLPTPHSRDKTELSLPVPLQRKASNTSGMIVDEVDDCSFLLLNCLACCFRR